MAGAPGTIGTQVPPGPDEVWRQIAELRTQAQQALAFAANAQATSAQLAANVAALAASGTTWAGPVASPSTVTAATAITSNGTGTVVGVFKNIAAYSNPITTSYRAVWVTSVDGQYGFNLSSRDFKEDIHDFTIDPLLASKLRVVTFRYIEAVELLGDAAATEVGLIAEEVEALAPWLVEHNPDTGKPEGIKFHLLALPALSALHSLNERVAALEAKA